MPLYEYQCQECGLRFERRQTFTEDPVKTCPECGGPVIRLIQPAGIIFKGSGFYVTDHPVRNRRQRSQERSKRTDHTPARSESETPKASTASSSEASNDKAKK